MESKHRVYRKHAMTPINFKKKTVKLLRNEQKEPYEMQKSDIFVKKSIKINVLKIKDIVDLEIIIIMQVSNKMLCIVYVI